MTTKFHGQDPGEAFEPLWSQLTPSHAPNEAKAISLGGRLLAVPKSCNQQKCTTTFYIDDLGWRMTLEKYPKGTGKLF